MRKFMVFVLATLIFAAPLNGYNQYLSINGAASWLAQRKVSVHCLTIQEAKLDLAIGIWGADAYVDGFIDHKGFWHPEDFTVFNYGLCETLDALAQGKAKDFSVQKIALALIVLTHEAGHLRGHRWSEDEALTQKWALRHVVYTAHYFGIPEPAARMVLYEAIQYHNSLPTEYHHPDCAEPYQDKHGLLKNCN